MSECRSAKEKGFYIIIIILLNDDIIIMCVVQCMYSCYQLPGCPSHMLVKSIEFQKIMML